MRLAKFQKTLTILIIVALAITAALQYQASRKSRDELDALRQQFAALAADNQTLSNRAQPTAPAIDQGELLRLRGEVARLRQQTNALGKVPDENRRLQAAAGEKSTANAEDEQLRFEGMGVRVINTGKQLGLAMRMWANDNNNLFPTNFEAIFQTNELEGVLPASYIMTNRKLLDLFELVNVGKADPNTPLAILARERVPRRNPQGGWERAYIFCDGFVDPIKSPDGDFDAWEQPNTNQVLELRPPRRSP